MLWFFDFWQLTLQNLNVTIILVAFFGIYVNRKEAENNGNINRKHGNEGVTGKIN